MKWWEIRLIIAKFILMLSICMMLTGIIATIRVFDLKGDVAAAIFFVTILISPVLVWALLVVADE